MKNCWRQFVGLFVFVLSASLAASAPADWNYDFESPLPASFTFNQIGPPSATFSAGIDNGLLRFRDPQINMHGPGFGGIGRDASQILDDVRISGILNAAGNSNDNLGLSIRNQALGNNTYGARIEFHSGRLVVFKIVNFAPAFAIFSDSPGQGSQPLLSDLARSYFLQFEVIGNVLDARAYDQPGGSELLHVHYVDDQGLGGPPLPPGLAGVSAIREEGSLDGAFDNISVMSVPEPGSCVLAVVGLAVLVSFHRNRLLNRKSL
jgi:hypothetical protein